MEELPSLIGGHFHRLSWLGRIHGLAVWSPHRFAAPRALSLPASRLPGRLPRRRAQIVQVGEMTFANVHLSPRPAAEPPPARAHCRGAARQAVGHHRRLQCRRAGHPAGLPRRRPARADALCQQRRAVPARPLPGARAHLPHRRCAGLRPVRPPADPARAGAAPKAGAWKAACGRGPSTAGSGATGWGGCIGSRLADRTGFQPAQI